MESWPGAACWYQVSALLGPGGACIPVPHPAGAQSTRQSPRTQLRRGDQPTPGDPNAASSRLPILEHSFQLRAVVGALHLCLKIPAPGFPSGNIFSILHSSESTLACIRSSKMPGVYDTDICERGQLGHVFTSGLGWAGEEAPSLTSGESELAAVLHANKQVRHPDRKAALLL